MKMAAILLDSSHFHHLDEVLFFALQINWVIVPIGQ